MMTIIAFMTSSLTLSLLVMVLGKMLKMKMTQDMEHTSPFECGFTPKDTMWKPFSVRFFILGIIFLIFDMELIILFPMFVNMETISAYSTMLFSLTLIALTTGFYYEWNLTKIQWTEFV